MAGTVEHSTLTTTNLHEPKGVASATAGQVYVADGAGSGSHKLIYTQGFEDYNDTGGSQSLTSGSFVDLQNDGAGTYTLTTYRLPGYSAIWDTTNDQFTWSSAGLSLGDTVDIRFDVIVTTTGSNHEVAARIDLAHGHASEYSLEFERRTFKTAGTYNLVKNFSIYMGDANTLNNPAKLAMYTDSTGNSVVVNGWFIRVIPRNPVTN